MKSEKLERLDPETAESLEVSISDIQGTGLVWMRSEVFQKDFRTGSVGFHLAGKLVNPENPSARYQVNLSIALIGSKRVK